MFVTLDHLDNSKSYRDVAMDVIATSRCLFSIKVTGARQSNDDAAWQAFRSEFDRIRVLINDDEGAIVYSKGGKFFSFWGIVNVVIFAAVGASVGAMIVFALTRRYQITPGNAARRYSMAIILLCLFMLADKVLVVALAGVGFETYEGVLLVLLVLALHLNAYIRRSPMAVLAAVSLVLGLFVAGIVYVALGWRALPRPAEAVGMAVGLAMLVYVLAGTLSRFTKPAGQAEVASG